MTEALMTDAATPTDGAQSQQTASASADANQQTANVEQAPETKKVEGEKTEGETAKPEGAPEKYEFKAPEGQQFDDVVIGAFSEVAKELNLTQDAAQKVVDKINPILAARQVEAVETAKKEWAEQTKSDKEIGGDKLTESMSAATKAFKTFATPEFAELLDKSGFGNHPEVIRVFAKVGKAISEDNLVVGGKRPSNGGKSHEAVLYPNQS